MTLSVGDRLGRYEILGPLGAGGMGEVFRARDTELERVVAVKVLPESFADNATRLERFQREARALAALSHPNLLDIYDVGSLDGVHYAVTELLEGDTLRQKIPTSGLPWQKVAEIGASVADGLAAAHGRGIVHRDLKPENLFVTADGRVKILDFGLARVAEGLDTEGTTDTVTEAGTIMGTPGYMAPEQVKGEPADARSDIFALGCVLYEMVAGRRAFGGDSGMEVMAAILKEEPPQLSSTGAKVPVDLERAVHRCLEKRPEARFQSAADLAYSLKQIGSSQAVPVMATPTETTSVAEKRRPRWQMAALVTFVLFAAVTSWWALTRRGDQVPAETTLTLSPNRIAVVPFVNRTGDVALDSLAARTADRLTQGVAELEEREVAPSSAVSAAAVGVDPATVAREVARGTDSGLVLTGVWDAVGAGLELQGTLEDAQAGRIVRAFDPIPASRAAPEEAIVTLRDWTLMAVQDHLHPALAFGAGDRLPKYEAYRAYRRWFETMGSGRWQDAVEIDSDFLRARIGPAFANALVDSPIAAKILEPLEGDPRLTTLQTHIVTGLRHHLEHRWEDAVSEFEWVLDYGHDNYGTRLMLLIDNLRANRPRSAIEHLERMGPTPFELRMTNTAVDLAADAYHLLGRYEEELEQAERLTAESGFLLAKRLLQARALIGLGRLDQLEPLVAESYTDREGPAGGFMLWVARLLHGHGYRTEGLEMATRAAEWWQNTNLVEGAGRCDVCTANCLSWAGRCQEALPVFQEHAAADPSNPGLWQGVAHVSACLGDRAAAQEALDRAVDLTEQTEADPWTVPLRRARVAAELGDRDEALRHLREAIAVGYYDYVNLPWKFVPLLDDPEFQEILRPKG
jgi:tetratricopeptide (TPR) repeat protein